MRRKGSFVAFAAGLGLALLAGPVAGQEYPRLVPRAPSPIEPVPIAPLHVPPGERPLPPTILTAFDPRIDGMKFTNVGDYGHLNRGNCYGMSLLAIDNYLQRMAGERPGDPRLPVRTRDGAQKGDLREQATASSAQFLTIPTQERLVDVMESAGHAEPIREALQRIAHTGEPEVLGFFNGGGDGHATVLMGWSDGHLHVYDPNYEGEVIRWPFDPETGLGPHPKAHEPEGALYRGIERVASKPADELVPSAELRAIRDMCDAGAAACTNHLLTFSELAARPDGRGTLVSGRVSSSAEWGELGPRADRVFVVIDGEASGLMATVDPGTGRFEASIPAGALRPDSTIQVMAATSRGDDPTPVFAGFGDVPHGGEGARAGDGATARPVKVTAKMNGSARSGSRRSRSPRSATAGQPTPTRGLRGIIDDTFDDE